MVFTGISDPADKDRTDYTIVYTGSDHLSCLGRMLALSPIHNLFGILLSTPLVD